MEREHIVVEGAKQHNLHIPHLAIPKRRLVVFTGVSGSGKSSLAFDTIYAEGQRRYVESLSSYARQFLGQMEKPRVDRIRGLSPTIAIEQKTASSNPRSTVGTITEIYDHLRVLYARVGEQRCHSCGRAVQARSAQEVAAEIARLPEGGPVLLLAPLVRQRKGEHRELLEGLAGRGFVRARIDGAIVRLGGDGTRLAKNRRHDIDLVVDRIHVGQTAPSRIVDSVELAMREGDGDVALMAVGSEERIEFSARRACTACDTSFPELAPQSFSFNSPLGMCPECNGLGVRLQMDPELVVAQPERSILQGAIEPWGGVVERSESWTVSIIQALHDDLGVDIHRPWRDLPARQRRLVLHGAGERKLRVRFDRKRGRGTWSMRYEGILNTLLRRYRQTSSERMRAYYRAFMSETCCTACSGERLRPESRSVYLGERTLPEVARMTVAEAAEHFAALGLGGSQAAIAAQVLREVGARLGFLRNVGLDYLTLDRSGPSLSGGEAQRIRLASQLGSELSGVTYVLDEPSVGLHQRDHSRLIDALVNLRDIGNTVLVVEHDADTIRRADHVVDFGPGAGALGGQVVFSGPPSRLVRHRSSLTGAYLSGREAIELPERRTEPSGWLRIQGATLNNLHGLDVSLGLGVITAITGVSGAGKSTLVGGVLLPALREALHGGQRQTRSRCRLEGTDALDKVIDIDQSPIGRTPRSNPATYTKAFDHIRKLFAMTPEARTFGYGPGRFSFNVRGGRCDGCDGDGLRRVEMHFLPDVFVTCEQCRGQRYNEATLRVRYRGHSIADVLDLSVRQALEVFAAVPPLARILQTLSAVGLNYLKLGQSAPTLSGGEAQRVKLSRELGRRDTGRTLYVLDEPTTGLHFDDIRKLLAVLRRLRDAGNTVVIIEHHPDVIRSADRVLDLGPEGGLAGGRVVAEGTPEEVARCRRSHTGALLQKLLPRRAARRGRPKRRRKPG